MIRRKAFACVVRDCLGNNTGRASESNCSLNISTPITMKSLEFPFASLILPTLLSQNTPNSQKVVVDRVGLVIIVPVKY
jgi:hypothetical protein